MARAGYLALVLGRWISLPFEMRSASARLNACKPSAGCPQSEAVERKLEAVRLTGALLDAHAASGNADDAFAAAAKASLPLLLAAYGATCSPADRALLAALQRIDSMAAPTAGGGGDGNDDAPSAATVSQGPLAATG